MTLLSTEMTSSSPSINRMTRIEFETVEAARQHLQSGGLANGAVFNSIDLRSIKAELAASRPRYAILLGCDIDSDVLDAFESPVIFPAIRGLPFQAFRSTLYTPDELLGEYVVGSDNGHAETLDGRCYKHYVENDKAMSTDAFVTLTRRLHDYSITDAMHEFIAGRKIVAIMGGHSMPRDEGWYLNVARLSRDLTRKGFLTASGGGPGAMEATHVGAWFANRDDSDLVDAVRHLSTAPLYDPIGPWMDTAFQVKEKYPLSSDCVYESLGIPTWLYGHEPPSCFATRIAKYFANSVREEGLLAIANCGVVFTPGSEGTMQEIFQDAAQNRYKTFVHASPMVFYGDDYWKYRKPIYPVLTTVSANRDYNKLISITDDPKCIVDTIEQFANQLFAGT